MTDSDSPQSFKNKLFYDSLKSTVVALLVAAALGTLSLLADWVPVDFKSTVVLAVYSLHIVFLIISVVLIVKLRNLGLSLISLCVIVLTLFSARTYYFDKILLDTSRMTESTILILIPENPISPLARANLRSIRNSIPDYIESNGQRTEIVIKESVLSGNMRSSILERSLMNNKMIVGVIDVIESGNFVLDSRMPAMQKYHDLGVQNISVNQVQFIRSGLEDSESIGAALREEQVYRMSLNAKGLGMAFSMDTEFPTSVLHYGLGEGSIGFSYSLTTPDTTAKSFFDPDEFYGNSYNLGSHPFLDYDVMEVAHEELHAALNMSIDILLSANDHLLGSGDICELIEDLQDYQDTVSNLDVLKMADRDRLIDCGLKNDSDLLEALYSTPDQTVKDELLESLYYHALFNSENDGRLLSFQALDGRELEWVMDVRAACALDSGQLIDLAGVECLYQNSQELLSSYEVSSSLTDALHRKLNSDLANIELIYGLASADYHYYFLDRFLKLELLIGSPDCEESLEQIYLSVAASHAFRYTNQLEYLSSVGADLEIFADAGYCENYPIEVFGLKNFKLTEAIELLGSLSTYLEQTNIDELTIKELAGILLNFSAEHDFTIWDNETALLSVIRDSTNTRVVAAAVNSYLTSKYESLENLLGERMPVLLSIFEIGIDTESFFPAFSEELARSSFWELTAAELFGEEEVLRESSGLDALYNYFVGGDLDDSSGLRIDELIAGLIENFDDYFFDPFPNEAIGLLASDMDLMSGDENLFRERRHYNLAHLIVLLNALHVKSVNGLSTDSVADLIVEHYVTKVNPNLFDHYDMVRAIHLDNTTEAHTLAVAIEGREGDNATREFYRFVAQVLQSLSEDSAGLGIQDAYCSEGMLRDWRDEIIERQPYLLTKHFLSDTRNSALWKQTVAENSERGFEAYLRPYLDILYDHVQSEDESQDADEEIDTKDATSALFNAMSIAKLSCNIGV